MNYIYALVITQLCKLEFIFLWISGQNSTHTFSWQFSWDLLKTQMFYTWISCIIFSDSGADKSSSVSNAWLRSGDIAVVHVTLLDASGKSSSYLINAVVLHVGNFCPELQETQTLSKWFTRCVLQKLVRSNTNIIFVFLHIRPRKILCCSFSL